MTKTQLILWFVALFVGPFIGFFIRYFYDRRKAAIRLSIVLGGRAGAGSGWGIPTPGGWAIEPVVNIQNIGQQTLPEYELWLQFKGDIDGYTDNHSVEMRPISRTARHVGDTDVFGFTYPFTDERTNAAIERIAVLDCSLELRHINSKAVIYSDKEVGAAIAHTLRERIEAHRTGRLVRS